MDARGEPRFSIYGAVKVTLLSSPERQLDCVLSDISATGLKLIAPESLSKDEVISIEAEDHLALADVRYSQPRGDKFTVGCERIHVLNKVSEMDQKSKAEQIRLLVDDYRNRIQTGLKTPPPNGNQVEPAGAKVEIPAVPPTSTPFATRDQLLETAATFVVEQWEKVPASQPQGPATRGEVVDRLAVHLAEKLRPPTPSPENTPENPTEKPPPPPKKKINIRRFRLPIGLAAAAILGWGLSAIFWSLGSSGAGVHLQSSIAALIAPKPAPAAEPVSSVRHAMIKAVEPTSVTASADGKRLFSKKLVKDDIREIDFSNKAVLRISNAKGVEITLDGKLVAPIGGRGQTRLVELSAAGVRLLPLN
jgi:Domain of unknown function (DUF4115)